MKWNVFHLPLKLFKVRVCVWGVTVVGVSLVSSDVVKRKAWISWHWTLALTDHISRFLWHKELRWTLQSAVWTCTDSRTINQSEQTRARVKGATRAGHRRRIDPRTKWIRFHRLVHKWSQNSYSPIIIHWNRLELFIYTDNNILLLVTVMVNLTPNPDPVTFTVIVTFNSTTPVRTIPYICVSIYICILSSLNIILHDFVYVICKYILWP